MYRPHAMWQCWRKCFVVELFAGTTCKDFSALLFIFIPFHWRVRFTGVCPTFSEITQCRRYLLFHTPLLLNCWKLCESCLCLRAIWAETENAWKPLCSEVGTKCWLQSPVRMAKLGNKRRLYESIHLTFVTFFREDFTRHVASILIWQTHTSLVSPWPLFKDSLTLFLRKHRKMCLMKPLILLQSCLPASHNPGSLFDLETNFCAKIN